MNRRLLCLFALTAVPAFAKPADTAKIFTDKGSTYFRTDKKNALEVGAELDAVVDAKDVTKTAGKAVIMEVNGALARISLDDDATKAGAKYVVLAKAPTSASHDDAADDDGKPPPPKLTGNKLKGRMEQAGLQFGWHNDSD